MWTPDYTYMYLSSRSVWVEFQGSVPFEFFHNSLCNPSLHGACFVTEYNDILFNMHFTNCGKVKANIWVSWSGAHIVLLLLWYICCFDYGITLSLCIVTFISVVANVAIWLCIDMYSVLNSFRAFLDSLHFTENVSDVSPVQLNSFGLNADSK